MIDDRARIYLTTSDVAHAAALTPGAVLRDVHLHRLRAAARTARGQHLFEQFDVDDYLRRRAKRHGAVA